MTISLRRRIVSVLLSLPAVLLSAVFVTEFVDNSYSPPSIQNKCTATGEKDPSFWPRPTSGLVKNIELTNEGEFVDRCQLTDVIDEVIWDRSEPPPLNIKPGAAGKPKPKLIVLFVHGWMHDGREGDSNHQSFEDLINKLAKDERKQVLGVYVTWNASTGSAILDYFSFWSRQRIADRITQSAVLTRIVGTIGSVRGISGQRDDFIAIGHSFGARILFAAVNAPLILDVTQAHPGSHSDTYRAFKGPADAIVLINPAFEASRYATLDSFIRNEEVFSQQQPPLMMIISTNNDWATKLAFPIGQFLGLVFDEQARTTIGNYQNYYTHYLFIPKPEECAGSDPSNLTEEYVTSGLCLRREPQWHRLSDENRTRDLYGWSDVPPERQRYNPFLVVHTTKDVIDNHGGFWDKSEISDKPVFADWLFDVLKTLDLRNDQVVSAVRPHAAQ